MVRGSQEVCGDQKVKWKTILGQCRYPVCYSKHEIRIGCTTKTAEEWHNWFATDEVYTTPRDSPMFVQIYKAFLIAEIAQKHDEGLMG